MIQKPAGTPRSPRRYARLSALIGGAIGGLILIVVSWAYLNPLEWAELKSRYELRQATGAKVAEIKGMLALMHFDSRGPEPSSPGLCWVFVHGSGDSLTTWKRFIRVLPPETRWIALDLPGQGGNRKERDPEKYRVTKTAERIWEGLGENPDALHACAKYRIVGNSFGGWVAARLALLHPEKTEKLILAGGVGLKTPELPPLQIFSAPSIEALKDFQAKAYFKPRELPDSIWKAALERAEKSEVPRIRESQKSEDWLDGGLAKLSGVRTLYIWGEADRIVPKEYAKTLSSQIPGAKFEILPRCGHLPQKECEAELYRVIEAN